jgi:hypothetical protein
VAVVSRSRSRRWAGMKVADVCERLCLFGEGEMVDSVVAASAPEASISGAAAGSHVFGYGT